MISNDFVLVCLLCPIWLMLLPMLVVMLVLTYTSVPGRQADALRFLLRGDRGDGDATASPAPRERAGETNTIQQQLKSL